MDVEKLTIVGQFIFPKKKKGHKKSALIHSEDIFLFALQQSGFEVLAIMYELDKESEFSNGKEVYNVRADLVSTESQPLTIRSIGEFFEVNDIRFIGNIFVESKL